MSEVTTVIVSIVMFVLVSADTDIQQGPGLHEWTDFLTRAEQVCMNITGISKTVIDKTKVTLELPDDPQYKEYISCFYKKQGYQNEDGDILFYNIKNMITDLSNNGLAVEIVNSCKDFIKTESHEEYAYTVAKCLLETSKQKLKPVTD